MQAIHHSATVFTLVGLLTAVECEALIAEAEAHGFEPAGVRTADGGQKSMAHVRNNERVVFESPHWVDTLWQRVRAADLPALDNEIPAGLPRALRFYKYGPGQRFRMRERGAPSGQGRRGDLIIEVRLVLPKLLDERSKELLREFGRINGEDVRKELAERR